MDVEGRQTYKDKEDYLSEDDEIDIRSENPREDAEEIISRILSEYYNDCSEGILSKIKDRHYYNLLYK